MRWSQMDGVHNLMEGRLVNMAAGEGKSIVYHAYAGLAAVRDGVVQIVLTRETLAAREFKISRRSMSPSGSPWCG